MVILLRQIYLRTGPRGFMGISKGFYHIIILLKLHPIALNQRTILWQNDSGIEVEWNI